SCFPMNANARTTALGWQTNGFSWITMSLPYFDQAPLYNQLDFNWPLVDEDNSNNLQLVQTPIPALLCPSDPTAAVRSALAGWWAYPAQSGSVGYDAGGPAGVTCYMGFQ